MRLILLLTAFSLAGCAGIQKPNVDLCIVNSGAANRKCYNLEQDYDDDGRLKPGAAPEYRRNASVTELNKALVIDSDEGFETGIERIKAYIKKIRQEAQNCEKVLE